MLTANGRVHWRWRRRKVVFSMKMKDTHGFSVGHVRLCVALKKGLFQKACVVILRGLCFQRTIWRMTRSVRRQDTQLQGHCGTTWKTSSRHSVFSNCWVVLKQQFTTHKRKGSFFLKALLQWQVQDMDEQTQKCNWGIPRTRRPFKDQNFVLALVSWRTWRKNGHSRNTLRFSCSLISDPTSLTADPNTVVYWKPYKVQLRAFCFDSMGGSSAVLLEHKLKMCII